jgi:hypothetical protein
MQSRSIELVLPQKTLPLPGRDVSRHNDGLTPAYTPQPVNDVSGVTGVQPGKSTYQQSARAELRLIVEFNPIANDAAHATAINIQNPPPKNLRQTLSSDVMRHLLADHAETSSDSSPTKTSRGAIGHYANTTQRLPTSAESLFSFAV